MQVRTAALAGFCPGVKRAVDKVYELIAERDNPIFTLGPIIHNESVVEDLEAKGVRAISLSDLDSLPENSTVVIRSHGVGKSVYEEIDKRNQECIDVTCTFVKKIHHIVAEKSREGFLVIIVGDPRHPEVQGICGWCEGPHQVIKSREDAQALSLEGIEKACIVCQTTFNYNKFQDLVEILEKKSYDNTVLKIFSVLNTICNATEKRQKEAKLLAGEVDTMLVIGGRHSSNTQKLFEICKKECGNTYYIQTPVDLDSAMFQSSSCVGITAGASTPKKMIEEVQEHVRVEF
ncbi:MAG: 4-hydroxy-3-methylbut-2-enyl diphosphate reductase [Eubacteriales bacterium]|nr:4-hydroxy-3-methylbut-2-enyl diphosphate reductase [Eubacteriales bacterium]